MICQKCQKREATCHITTIVYGVMTSSELCIDCHEASSPEAREMRMARCEYCGGQSCTGGTETVGGIRKSKFMCMPCSGEQHRYTLQRLVRVDSGLPLEEQQALLRALEDEVKLHMKQWVAERSSE
jgi:hypothetical protein